MKCVICALFFLQSVCCFAQPRLISKKPIDLKYSDYWASLSKNDSLVENLAYLDSLRFYEIVYKSDSLKIKGYIVEPVRASKLPAVIFNRGGNKGYHDLSLVTLIEWLAPIAKEGYVVIASNYRGSPGSEGNDEFGGADVNDALNLIPVIEELPNIDVSRIGMYGWSRGGMMTYLALKQSKRIKTAIVGGAPSDLIAELQHRPEMEELYKNLIPNYTSNKIVELQHRSAIYWPDSLSDKTSLLIMHGKNDWRVNYKQAVDLFMKLKSMNRRVELKIFEGADHIINEYRKQKDQQIINWLKLNL